MKAVVSAAVLPVRWADFDAGILSQVLTPEILGRAAMVMTTSRTDSDHYDVERFAGNVRSNSVDNTGRNYGSANYVGAPFLLNTLPYRRVITSATKFLPGPGTSSNPDSNPIVLDQSYLVNGVSTTARIRDRREWVYKVCLGNAPAEGRNVIVNRFHPEPFSGEAAGRLRAKDSNEVWPMRYSCFGSSSTSPSTLIWRSP